MTQRLCYIVYLLLVMSEPMQAQVSDFVRVRGLEFHLNDRPYYFLGTNFWYGMNLAIDGAAGDRDRLIRELDRLQGLGVNNLRIMGSTEGPDTEPWRVKPSQQRAPGEYNEQVLAGLDFLLAEMKKRNMYAVVCLSNFWAWSGGMSQYVSWANDEAIPYHPPQKGGSWMRYQRFTSSFYRDKKAQEIFENHLRVLIERVNTISGLSYKDDPTIMAWQLANEPRSFVNGRTFRKWIDKTAGLIKQLDPNHLVSLGGEGDADNYFAGASFRKDQKSKHIDYLTMHIWVQNWSWYNPHEADDSFNAAIAKAKEYIIEHVGMAKAMGKPVVLEEFGIARDLEAYESETPVKYRDNYYSRIFQEIYRLASIGEGVVGCNFWAWAGEGRPEAPGGFWKSGHDLIGDPPHERQGWYSVYDTDESTLGVIGRFAAMFNELGKPGNNSEK